VIPTVYEIFDEWREWMMRKAQRFLVKPHPTEPVGESTPGD
jgi:hypothetical protein